MPSVFKCLYEVPADLPQVVDHFATVDAATAANLDYVDKVGALGFYTSSFDGSMTGVIFDSEKLVGEMNATWKRGDQVYAEGVGRAYLCVPKKTKTASDVRAAFDLVPAIPQGSALAKALGWPGKRPSDGRKVHWATVSRLLTPGVRIIVQLPRQIGDGFEPPDFFTEITEGDYMRAVAAHNARLETAQ